jgi:hypothetical protein
MTFILPARPLPLDDSWEVIVVGGGPAGCAAATAAARDGARTLLIEATGCLGGMGTMGLVPAWCPFTDGKRRIYRGLAERVFTTSNAGLPHVDEERMYFIPLDAERLKRIYDNLVSEAGVTVLFHTRLAAVELAGPGVVDTLLLANKAGLSAYRARIYVDCTGDGDLAAWAGAEFEQGTAETGELQPASHCFTLTNVDEYAFNTEPTPVQEILTSGKFPLIADAHLGGFLVGPAAVGFNAGHLWEVDGTDPVSVSAAMLRGRKLAEQIQQALAQYQPRAFANSHLAVTGALMGIRETRRIVGDYRLTVEDYLARRSFPDEISRNSYPIDIHIAPHEIDAFVKGNLHGMTRYPRYRAGESHGIPYRCLTPKELRNVLVAGRALSCDRIAHGSLRVMPACLTTGEAAGIAAAFAAQTDGDVHRVDPTCLRERLREMGAYLP